LSFSLSPGQGSYPAQFGPPPFFWEALCTSLFSFFFFWCRRHLRRRATFFLFFSGGRMRTFPPPGIQQRRDQVQLFPSFPQAANRGPSPPPFSTAGESLFSGARGSSFSPVVNSANESGRRFLIPGEIIIGHASLFFFSFPPCQAARQPCFFSFYPVGSDIAKFFFFFSFPTPDLAIGKSPPFFLPRCQSKQKPSFFPLLLFFSTIFGVSF